MRRLGEQSLLAVDGERRPDEADGVQAAASAVTSTRVSKKAIALAVAGSAAATLVNPYGVEMWGFLAETVRPARPWIDDWRPLLATPALLPFWLPVAAAAGFGLWRARRTIPLSHTLIVADRRALSSALDAGTVGGALGDALSTVLPKLLGDLVSAA